MSHTNSTTNYNLPQFVTTDKPAWLTDINNAFYDIDAAIKAAKTAGDDAQGDATQALSDAADAYSVASTADGKGSGAIASIAPTFDSTSTYAYGDKVIYNNLLYTCIDAVITPGAWTGSANWSRTNVNSIVDDVADDKADKTENITFYPDAGVSASSVIAARTDKMITFSGEFNLTASANAWKTLGLISAAPNATHAVTAAVNTSNGTFAGMVSVNQSDNTVKFYPVTNVSNGYIAFSVSYRTA